MRKYASGCHPQPPGRTLIKVTSRGQRKIRKSFLANFSNSFSLKLNESKVRNKSQISLICDWNVPTCSFKYMLYIEEIGN